MTPQPTPESVRDVVLVGGGHSHALALRMIGMQPLPGARVTLVSESAFAPYSGMLPGHVGGFYRWEEMHIDLRSLCAFAGVAFVEGRVSGLDLERRQVTVDGGPPIQGDVLSLNVGAIPNLAHCPGADARAIPSKPVPRLLEGWDRVRTAVRHSKQTVPIVIVGGGAGGVELALTMQRQVPERSAFTVIQHGTHILPGHNARVRTILTRLLRHRGITVRTGTRVEEVTPDAVRCSDGTTEPAAFVFWITQATPSAWVGASGLSVTPHGFVRVSPTLQSVSHPWVFATGDMATVENAPRPKTGVFAVRMARPLVANLRATCAGEPLQPYRPQRHTLNLIGTADGKAVASRRWLAGHSTWFWRWKDRIDRRFMRQFLELPGAQEGTEPKPREEGTDPGMPGSWPG